MSKGRPESKSEPAQTQAANRKAKLEEQKRDRWANKDRSTEDP
jgi:hypothetical protein